MIGFSPSIPFRETRRSSSVLSSQTDTLTGRAILHLQLERLDIASQRRHLLVRQVPLEGGHLPLAVGDDRCNVGNRAFQPLDVGTPWAFPSGAMAAEAVQLIDPLGGFRRVPLGRVSTGTAGGAQQSEQQSAA